MELLIEDPEMVSAREIIIRELKTGPKMWSELRDAVKKELPITTATYQYHLSKLIKENKVEKVVHKDGKIIYEEKKFGNAVDLSGSLTVEPRPELKEAKKEEITFLLAIIQGRVNEEAINLALIELDRICRREIVTNYEEIWDFFENALRDEAFSAHWHSLLFDLIQIINNSTNQKDMKTIERLKKDFLPRVLEIAKTAKTLDIKNICIDFIDKLITDNEKFNILKEIAEKEIKEEGRFPNFYPLREMYKTRKIEIWQWLFELIEKGDEKTRKRASDMLQDLRAG